MYFVKNVDVRKFDVKEADVKKFDDQEQSPVRESDVKKIDMGLFDLGQRVLWRTRAKSFFTLSNGVSKKFLYNGAQKENHYVNAKIVFETRRDGRNGNVVAAAPDAQGTGTNPRRDSSSRRCR